MQPERAHHFSLSVMKLITRIKWVKRSIAAYFRPPTVPSRTVFGLTFKNPVGLAAGFDKNGEHIDVLTDLGFGFVEVGSVTARPAVGNPKPRLFRIPQDGGLINRMGLNNHGVAETAHRLSQSRRDIPIFVNIAKSPDPTIEGQEAIDDYIASIIGVHEHADVIVLNISCPNSGDGRTFEDPEWLKPLLKAVHNTLSPTGKPWLVKVSPDLDESSLSTVVGIAVECGVYGFTATNTTVSRDGLVTSSTQLKEIGPGGLSGAPLHQRALNTVRTIRGLTDLPIIGVGGIRTGIEAKAFLDEGASLVQMYTGFIYGGPGTVKKICRQL